MWTLQTDDFGYFIEVKFDTVDGREWYFCTESHLEIKGAVNDVLTGSIEELSNTYDRMKWATVIHEVKGLVGISSPGPLPRLYQQVRWKVGQHGDSVGYLALDQSGKVDHNLLIVRVYNDGTVKVHDANGLNHGVFDYPGATLYEKFLNIPTIFPNVE